MMPLAAFDDEDTDLGESLLSEEITQSRQKSCSLPDSCVTDSGHGTATFFSGPNGSALKKLFSVITELVQTESAYLQSLRDLEDGYLNVLQADGEFEPKLLNVIFPMVGRLRSFHEFFKTTLNANSPSLYSLAHTFLLHIPRLKALYVDYCISLSRALSVLDTVWRTRPELACRLVECQKNLKHVLPVETYLVQPFQRVMRYQLLLQEMLKYSYYSVSHTGDTQPPLHAIHGRPMSDKSQEIRIAIPMISQALSQMIKINENINESKRRHELLEHLCSQRGGIDPDWGNLLLADDMYVTGKKNPRLVLLFEQVMVVCKHRPVGSSIEGSTSMISSGGPAQHGLFHSDLNFQVRKVMQCSNLMLVEFIAKEQSSFQVVPFGQPKKPMILKAPNVESKTKWCAEITQRIMQNFGAVIPEKAWQLLMTWKPSDQTADEVTPPKYDRRKRGRSCVRKRMEEQERGNKPNGRNKSCAPDVDSVRLSYDNPQDTDVVIHDRNETQKPASIRQKLLALLNDQQQSTSSSSECEDERSFLTYPTKPQSSRPWKFPSIFRSNRKPAHVTPTYIRSPYDSGSNTELSQRRDQRPGFASAENVNQVGNEGDSSTDCQSSVLLLDGWSDGRFSSSIKDRLSPASPAESVQSSGSTKVATKDRWITGDRMPNGRPKLVPADFEAARLAGDNNFWRQQLRLPESKLPPELPRKPDYLKTIITSSSSQLKTESPQEEHRLIRRSASTCAAPATKVGLGPLPISRLRNLVPNFTSSKESIASQQKRIDLAEIVAQSIAISQAAGRDSRNSMDGSMMQAALRRPVIPEPRTRTPEQSQTIASNTDKKPK